MSRNKGAISEARKKKIKEISAQILVEKKGDETHVTVSNLPGLAELAKLINIGNLAKEYSQMLESLKFLDWLEAQPAPAFGTYKVTWNSNVYRVYSKSYSAYSISGSLSSGGRLNLGGSQRRVEFPSLKPFGALYFSEDIDTATKEYSDSAPLGPNDSKYKVQLSKSFDLWDYDKIVDSLSYVGLKDAVKGSPVTAIWADCKVPMQSQIVACWLRNFGGDGFIFESTKNVGKKNIVLFFKDDATAFSQLSFQTI